MTTLNDLGNIITKALPKTSFNIKAEIRQPKIKNGHMYLSLKDKTSEISCIVWKNTEIDEVKDGDIVNVTGRLSYYQPRGSLNLVLSSMELDSDEVGDSMKQYELMKIEFEQKGYFIKHPLPQIIKKIIILSSSSGAAIHDFYYTLDNNKSLVERTLIDVVVQGIDCPSSIVKAFNNISQDYDLVIVTRGGGSMEDLWGFNHRDIVEVVHACPIPVMSAIGHMVDTTLIDYVADVSCPTPSLAAQYIVDHNTKYIDYIEQISIRSKQYIINMLNKTSDNITRWKYEIKANIDKFEYKLYKSKLYVESLIQTKIKELEGLEYVDKIKIICNNKIVDSSNSFQDIINKKQSFTIIWNNVKLDVKL
jgi:exodeoxyribonuclease VII large subunit